MPCPRTLAVSATNLFVRLAARLVAIGLDLAALTPSRLICASFMKWIANSLSSFIIGAVRHSLSALTPFRLILRRISLPRGSAPKGSNLNRKPKPQEIFSTRLLGVFNVISWRTIWQHFFINNLHFMALWDCALSLGIKAPWKSI